MFSPQFAERLRGGKYTKWITAVPFSEEHLECLLWAIGEFATHGSRILRVLGEAREEGRGCLALDALWWVVSGERFDLDGWRRCMARHGRPLQVADVPQTARPALDALTATWEFTLAVGRDYELIGKDATGQPFYAYVSAAGSVIYSGTKRQKGQLKGSSVIPAALDERMAHGKCTAWAAARGFPEEEMRCLLWLVYEFACRSWGILKLLEREKDRLSEQRRSVLALHAMERITGGERFHTAELLRRMEHGRAHMEYEDLPSALRTVLERAAPGFTWSAPMMRPDCFVTHTAASGKSETQARLYHDGRLEFRKCTVPPGVLTAVESRLPGYEVVMGYTVGRTPDTIDHYELVLLGPAHKLHESFVMSADGSVIERREWRN